MTGREKLVRAGLCRQCGAGRGPGSTKIRCAGCAEKARERNAKYRAENPEKDREYKAKYIASGQNARYKRERASKRDRVVLEKIMERLDPEGREILKQMDRKIQEALSNV